MKIAVIQFPGSNCDFDTIHVLKNIMGVEAELVWHKNDDLRKECCAFDPGLLKKLAGRPTTD